MRGDHMKGPFVTVLLTLVFLVAPLSPAAAAGVSPMQTEPLHTILRIGTERIFNMDTQGAVVQFQKAVGLDRENPVGYAFLALTYLFAYEMNFEQKDRETNQGYMLRYADEAIALGEKRLAKKPDDVQAHYAVVLAKIAKIRWAIGLKRYTVIVRETTNIWDYCEKIRSEEPQHFDVYFPMGLLHYHLDLLPGFSRFISSLLITSGDRKKGLQELELAAQKGDLLKELAQAELVSVYSNYEKMPQRALPLARKLRDTYPRNYNFSFALANIAADLQRFDEAYAIARDIEKGIASRTSPYVPQLQPRYALLMGRILFNQQRYDQAADYFEQAQKVAAPYNARIRAWALVRLGMISDARKDRKKAQDYYSQALDVEGGEGAAQVDARKYLSAPYVPPPAK
jgi:tetratricopeptide (TPR) repeat protein